MQATRVLFAFTQTLFLLRRQKVRRSEALVERVVAVVYYVHYEKEYPFHLHF